MNLTGRSHGVKISYIDSPLNVDIDKLLFH